MNDLATAFDTASPDAWAERINACWRDSVEAIFTAGRLIAEAKASLPHGDWRGMIREKLTCGERTAQRLMAVAQDQRLSNPTHVSLLPPHWGTLYELTRLDDTTFADRVADGTINPRMERKDITQAVKATARTTRETMLGAVQTLFPKKRYGVIYADPEWRFEVYSRDTGMDRAADNHYPTSATDAICARPVGDLAAPDSALFLWATSPMMPDALRVMAAWGFTYKSQIVWKKDRFGTGYWFRNQHELLLVGTRGNVPAPAMGTQWPSVIEAPVGQHSAKPDIFYELIESYFPTLPKIELNARRARAGWDAWGNEALEAMSKNSTNLVVEKIDITTPAMIAPETAQAPVHPESNLTPCEKEALGGGMPDLPDFLRRVPVASPTRVEPNQVGAGDGG